jgi:hypothetical protein
MPGDVIEVGWQDGRMTFSRTVKAEVVDE